MWSPKESSVRVHLVQSVGGRGESGRPRILRIARGNAEEGMGGSCRRGCLGRGRRIHEREEGREERRSWSRAGAEERRAEYRESADSLFQ